MKKRAKQLLALLLGVIMLVSIMVVPVAAAQNNSSSGGSGNKVSISDISQILNAKSYVEYRKEIPSTALGVGQIVLNATDGVFDDGNPEDETDVIKDYEGQTGILYVPDKGTVTWTFDVENAGNYIIEIEYCQTGNRTNSIERIFYINGEVPFSEARSVVLSKVWKYNYKKDAAGNVIYDEAGFPTFELDKNGNDVRPAVQQSAQWVTYPISDSNGYEQHPFQFYFAAGENKISLESQREPVLLKSITLRPYKALPSYAEYIEANGSIAENTVSKEDILAGNTGKGSLDGKDYILIEAEAPHRVSNVTMYPVYDRTSVLTSGLTGPQEATLSKYNSAGKEQWQTVGEWMSYNITVPKDGYYKIAVRYKQALLSGMYVTRKVYVDGVIPFEEANNCKFPFSDSWSSIYLGDGTHEFNFYLTAGTHEIKLEAALDKEMGEQIEKVSNALSVINSCYLEILKLTGSDPDTNRDYDFSRVMPDVMQDLVLQYSALKGVYETLSKSGKGETISTIEQVYLCLEKMAKDETQIAGNLATLKSHIGSLGTWVNSAKSQPLQVDFYSIQSPEADLPRGDANFFEALWFEIELFFASWVIDYNSIGGGEENESAHNVEVWVVTGRDQAQIIRNLIDSPVFTDDNPNVSVSLKLISGGTLLPSVLAGVGPDVSLMEASTTIIDYALRDAVYPLNEFVDKEYVEVEAGKGDFVKNADGTYTRVADGKGNYINNALSDLPDASLIPLTLYDYDIETGIEHKTYFGMPDSLTFPMMFYRKDVLASLELDIPETWDDMLSILPVLQYNNMEIGIQNDIYTFVYQSNEEAYSNHGMTINFDDTGVTAAFTKLCNMYTQYSLPYTFDFANRFRTGEMPIGIAPYTTCNQLAIFATELSGLWSFVPLPGMNNLVVDDEGNPVLDANGQKQYDYNNCAVATVTGCIMLSGCEEENRQSAWDFIKWYTGKNCQVEYSNAIVSIMGIAARPATANKEALKELPWTSEEKENILAQFDNLTAVENHPGSYYLARYVSFAFLAAYNDGKNPADSLYSYVKTINEEMNRRRIEFQNRDTDNPAEKRYMYTIFEYEEYLKSQQEGNK
ncbi:MAG: extracellular solute-binding protein [Clostridia bacterium]|nr:extracellular solute-binding protein [Clostridia bacterium]